MPAGPGCDVGWGRCGGVLLAGFPVGWSVRRRWSPRCRSRPRGWGWGVRCWCASGCVPAGAWRRCVVVRVFRGRAPWCGCVLQVVASWCGCFAVVVLGGPAVRLAWLAGWASLTACGVLGCCWWSVPGCGWACYVRV